MIVTCIGEITAVNYATGQRHPREDLKLRGNGGRVGPKTTLGRGGPGGTIEEGPC